MTNTYVDFRVSPDCILKKDSLDTTTRKLINNHPKYKLYAGFMDVKFIGNFDENGSFIVEDLFPPDGDYYMDTRDIEEFCYLLASRIVSGEITVTIQYQDIEQKAEYTIRCRRFYETIYEYVAVEEKEVTL